MYVRAGRHASAPFNRTKSAGVTDSRRQVLIHAISHIAATYALDSSLSVQPLFVDTIQLT
jgi:hypothetical protein